LAGKASVKSLYPLALLEGEGMGTAYEYSVKIALLERVAQMCGTLKRVLIGGLPEKYGLDLGVALFAASHKCEIMVVDPRPDSLVAFAGLILRLSGAIEGMDAEQIETELVDSLAQPVDEDSPTFDLWISTSAIQRLDADALESYLDQVRSHTRYAVLFAPNKGNAAHLTISGLDGFHLSSLFALCTRAGLQVLESGYLDLPPFPPGIRRSEEAKAKASTSLLARLAMVMLEGWGRIERHLPGGLKRRHSHLVYVVLRPAGTLTRAP
jgi:hypothetical protein